MTGQQISIARPAGRALSIPTLPALATFIAVLLLLSAIVLVVSVMQGAQFGNGLLHPNPFTAYQALWPGQSLSSVADYARRTANGSISCNTRRTPDGVFDGLVINVNPNSGNSGYSTPDNQIECMTDNQPDLFRAIRVTLLNNRVKSLVLFSDSLQQDALLLYWGIPDSIKGSPGGRVNYLLWDRDTYSAIALVTKSDSMVQLLTLSANG